MYLYARLSFATAALVVEGQKYFGALKRSWSLSAGHGWRVVGIMLLMGVIVAVLSLSIGSALNAAVMVIIKTGRPALAAAITGTVSAIISIILDPLASIILIVLYYDLRIRKEGFDLQILAQDLSARGETAPSGLDG
jgi:membrane-anchored glycerophosphoryl diester phosphodiesterase (GDPDase)